MDEGPLGSCQVAGPGPRQPEIVPETPSLMAGQEAAADSERPGRVGGRPGAVLLAERAGLVEEPGDLPVIDRRPGLRQLEVHGRGVATVPGGHGSGEPGSQSEDRWPVRGGRESPADPALGQLRLAQAGEHARSDLGDDDGLLGGKPDVLQLQQGRPDASELPHLELAAGPQDPGLGRRPEARELCESRREPAERRQRSGQLDPLLVGPRRLARPGLDRSPPTPRPGQVPRLSLLLRRIPVLPRLWSGEPRLQLLQGPALREHTATERPRTGHAEPDALPATFRQADLPGESGPDRGEGRLPEEGRLLEHPRHGLVQGDGSERLAPARAQRAGGPSRVAAPWKPALPTPHEKPRQDVPQHLLREPGPPPRLDPTLGEREPAAVVHQRGVPVHHPPPGPLEQREEARGLEHDTQPLPVLEPGAGERDGVRQGLQARMDQCHDTRGAPHRRPGLEERHYAESNRTPGAPGREMFSGLVKRHPSSFSRSSQKPG